MGRRTGAEIEEQVYSMVSEFPPSNETLASLPEMRWRSWTLRFDMRLNLSDGILSLQMFIPAHRIGWRSHRCISVISHAVTEAHMAIRGYHSVLREIGDDKLMHDGQ